MTYLIVKYLHSLTALLTISGFILRGAWMIKGNPLLQRRVTKIAPHVVDTVFFLAGIALVWMLNLNVITQPWLLFKFVGLIVYIVLGTIAIKRGPTLQIRIIAFIAAIAVFAYIIGVAIAKSPASWLKMFAG